MACLAIAVAVGGCGGDGDDRRPHPAGALADGTVPALPRPVPIGTGPALRPGPGPGPLETVGLGACRTHRARPTDAAHLELFAAGRVLVVPAGIGIAPPRRRQGAFVTAGRCTASLRTTEPTGLIELAAGHPETLGDLFTVWGRALTAQRLLGFRGPVRAWVDGVRWRRSVRAIPLRHHGQIVLISGPQVPVHATYAFPPPGTTHLHP